MNRRLLIGLVVAFCIIGLALSTAPLYLRVVPSAIVAAVLVNRWLRRNGYTLAGIIRRAPRDY